MVNLNLYPSVKHLHAAAKKKLPKFSLDYVEGGTGLEVGLRRNREALDATTINPKYINDWPSLNTEVNLFGRNFSYPFGIAPMGLASLQWPKAELIFADAAKNANIPVGLSTSCTVAIEEFGAAAGDHGWFQLYPPQDEEINDDLLERAERSGLEVLMVTVDVPARGWRPRDMYNGLSLPPRVTAASLYQAACRPRWSLATLASGIPYFKTMGRYSKDKSFRGMADFIRQELGKPVTRERLKHIRRKWKGPLVIKGIMHPADAEAAVKMGYDGILVSNHGGRQLDACLSPVEVLADIITQVDGRAMIMVDSGFSNGLDIARGIALGADFVFCGRAFMWGVSVLGQKGPEHVINLLSNELQLALTQIGCPSVNELNTSWLDAKT
ncbi:MAG: alpha-hydroxy acid oxidase [Pseudomonadota bacterium]|jgi:L-lactate dehydrogenase (cytochrome)|nr:alpha-hydroxy acid oxidase [Pseudomonadota bacterium]|tara:strand:+ start:1580 stop:2728 length:1149 start_codon:yes stop_codon:yes gene_type:complete